MTSYTPYVLPKITLDGTPFEIGRRYGELARVRILLHLSNQKTVAAGLKPEDPDWWRDEVRRYLPVYEEMAPHFVEEMQGLARGAELGLDEVLLLNTRDELAIAGRPLFSDECTSFGCSGGVSVDGQPLCGQTKDTAPVSRDLYIILSIRQRGRPDVLQLSYAGELHGFGLSSAGMASFGNSIYVRGRGQGRLPWSIFRRLVLEAHSVAGLLSMVQSDGLAGAGNLLIGDSTGRLVSIENTDHGHAVVEARDGILVHTNHIDSPLARWEVYDEPLRSGSVKRQQRLRELLEGERGRLTAPLALRFLTDHSNYPMSICSHLPAHMSLQTTCALVAEPGRGLLHAIRGLPCRGWPATYTL